MSRDCLGPTLDMATSALSLNCASAHCSVSGRTVRPVLPGSVSNRVSNEKRERKRHFNGYISTGRERRRFFITSVCQGRRRGCHPQQGSCRSGWLPPTNHVACDIQRGRPLHPVSWSQPAVSQGRTGHRTEREVSTPERRRAPAAAAADWAITSVFVAIRGVRSVKHTAVVRCGV